MTVIVKIKRQALDENWKRQWAARLFTPPTAVSRMRDFAAGLDMPVPHSDWRLHVSVNKWLDLAKRDEFSSNLIIFTHSSLQVVPNIFGVY
jgi:hypothetical protein